MLVPDFEWLRRPVVASRRTARCTMMKVSFFGEGRGLEMECIEVPEGEKRI